MFKKQEEGEGRAMNIVDMDIEELKEKINKELKERNISVNKLCKELDICKATLLKRFKKSGIRFDKELHQYIKYEVEEETNNNIASGTIVINENNTKILKELEEIKERLNKLESISKDNAKTIVIDNKKDTVVKSIRLYKEVKEELDKFILDHKEIKVMDIINNAIVEYIHKHK